MALPWLVLLPHRPRFLAHGGGRAQPPDVGPSRLRPACQDELVTVFLSGGLFATLLLPTAWWLCLSSGTTTPGVPPTSPGRGGEPRCPPWGTCTPKPRFVCLSFLYQSVNLYSLGIVLSICVNVNVDPVGIYSHFYFILFSRRRGGGGGTAPRVTPRAAEGAGPRQPGCREEQPPGATPDSGLQESQSQAVIWHQKPASVPCPTRLARPWCGVPQLRGTLLGNL